MTHETDKALIEAAKILQTEIAANLSQLRVMLELSAVLMSDVSVTAEPVTVADDGPE